jgi:parallel beta-helix repeat protein
MQNGVVADGERGGGVMFQDASPSMTDCIVTGSYAGSGGGIFCDGSSPSLEDCVITGNTAGGTGGGIRSSFGSDPILIRCNVSSNQAMDGGGMWIGSNSDPVLSYCTFLGNVADFWGGGIACQGATPVFQNCTIVDNEAGLTGGGIWCCFESVAHLENTIVAFSREGGGIHCYIDFSHPSNALLTCCDVFGNAEGEYGGSLEDQTGINGNISEDPRFCDPDLDDYRLYSDSPCLPQGNECSVLMGAHDLGCYIAADVKGSEGARMTRSTIRPNPFRPATTVSFRLIEDSIVSLRMYDLKGRLVRSLLDDARYDKGSYRVEWDGRDESGTRVSPGIYFYRLVTEVGTTTGKATLLD